MEPKSTLQEENKHFLHRVGLYLKKLILLTDTDSELTIQNISQSVEFKGVNVWVLFFAIVVASVGLNVNSTAVIIGAMLISPLMSPIMGLGLAIGINDNQLLFKSLRNLLVMMTISLLASSCYFFISPLSDAQSELLARTQPTIYDVLIAFFGGLAGIVATSRKQEKITVVSGVAIATALMPPLCTAGYGLATAQFHFFFGAFYLFFINSFFIALATYVMVRHMKFPKKSYRDAHVEKKVRYGIGLFSVITIVPSVIMAFFMIKESSFNSQVIRFVSDVNSSKVFDNVNVVDAQRFYSRDSSNITLTFVGKPLSDEQVQVLHEYLVARDLSETTLRIRQAGAATLDIESQNVMIQQFMQQKDLEIERKDSTIKKLEATIEQLQEKRKVSPMQLVAEIKTIYPQIRTLSVGTSSRIDANTLQQKEEPKIELQWNRQPSDSLLYGLNKWLKLRLENQNLLIEHK